MLQNLNELVETQKFRKEGFWCYPSYDLEGSCEAGLSVEEQIVDFPDPKYYLLGFEIEGDESTSERRVSSAFKSEKR